MVMMAMIQIHEYATGWRSDHGSPGRAGALGLPNSFLSASATVVIGFHEAMVRIVRAFEDRARALYGRPASR